MLGYAQPNVSRGLASPWNAVSFPPLHVARLCPASSGYTDTALGLVPREGDGCSGLPAPSRIRRIPLPRAVDSFVRIFKHA